MVTGMKKIAIIGASYLQEPLIQKAKNMGLETHVFAWECDDVGERSADVFYPISTVEKEKIYQKCMEIGIDGICSIASDVAAVTVDFVANRMGLVGNSQESSLLSSNKRKMREAFEVNGDPSPKCIAVEGIGDLNGMDLQYPVIVKPVDRSGSRGITKLITSIGLEEAIEYAKSQGFLRYVLVEEFAEGSEYSVECISFNGVHRLLAITQKYTTGSPHFIEIAHLEPAQLAENTKKKIENVTFHALDSLQIKNGASHTELKIDDKGNILLIEIGARMGGDCIGSHLVSISTGIDFVKAVIQIALGEKPSLDSNGRHYASAVRYIFTEEDHEVYRDIINTHPEYIVYSEIPDFSNEIVTDSSTRHGFYVFAAPNVNQLLPYLPDKEQILN